MLLPLQTITRYCQYKQIIRITIFQYGLSPSDHLRFCGELTTIPFTKLKLNVAAARARGDCWPTVALAQVARKHFCWFWGWCSWYVTLVVVIISLVMWLQHRVWSRFRVILGRGLRDLKTLLNSYQSQPKTYQTFIKPYQTLTNHTKRLPNPTKL